MEYVKQNIFFLSSSVSTHDTLSTLSSNLLAFAKQSSLRPPLLWIQPSFTSDVLFSLLKTNSAHYHHNCTSRYNQQKIDRLNARASKESDEAQDTRSKRKSGSEARLIECVFCGEKEKDLSKRTKDEKRKTSEKASCSRRISHQFPKAERATREKFNTEVERYGSFIGGQ